jgi:hypothetical protein
MSGLVECSGLRGFGMELSGGLMSKDADTTLFLYKGGQLGYDMQAYCFAPGAK